MKIGLQDAVGAVHGAITTDMQNLIPAAMIVTRPRARFDKPSLVAGQNQYPFGRPFGVRCVADLIKNRVE